MRLSQDRITRSFNDPSVDGLVESKIFRQIEPNKARLHLVMDRLDLTDLSVGDSLTS